MKHQDITSSQSPRRGTRHVAVAQFSRDESVALLRASAPTLDDAAADRIAAEIGDLPLAVQQAAAQLADGSLDADTYLA